MTAILDFLLGCRHRRRTWPRQTIKKTYVVCLSCGKEIPYNNPILVPKL